VHAGSLPGCRLLKDLAYFLLGDLIVDLEFRARGFGISWQIWQGSF